MSYNMHKVPLRPVHTGSFLPEDHPHVLFVLGLVNQAITPQFPDMAEILKDLICDQTLCCFIL